MKTPYTAIQRSQAALDAQNAINVLWDGRPGSLHLFEQMSSLIDRMYEDGKVDAWLDTNMAPDGMMEEFVMARKMESDEEVYVKMLDPRDELTAEEWDKAHAIWKSSSERR